MNQNKEVEALLEEIKAEHLQGTGRELAEARRIINQALAIVRGQCGTCGGSGIKQYKDGINDQNRRCGTCDKWMKKSTCPAEKNGGKPSMSDSCDSYVMADSDKCPDCTDKPSQEPADTKEFVAKIKRMYGVRNRPSWSVIVSICDRLEAAKKRNETAQKYITAHIE